MYVPTKFIVSNHIFCFEVYRMFKNYRGLREYSAHQNKQKVNINVQPKIQLRVTGH